MRLDFYVSNAEKNKFASSLEVLLRNVGTATLKGTRQACQEILEASLEQVPRDTGTLASTGFYDVSRRITTKRYTYEGIVGYAGMTGAGYSRDKLNPKSGSMVSDYAVRVHEDLNASHPNGGKAKFLEDPIRAYAASNFKRVAEANWRYAIERSASGVIMHIPEAK